MLQSFILKVTYVFINLSSLKKECLFERVRKIREKYAVGQREPSFDETTHVPPFIDLDLGKTGKRHQKEKRRSNITWSKKEKQADIET